RRSEQLRGCHFAGGSTGGQRDESAVRPGGADARAAPPASRREGRAIAAEDDLSAGHLYLSGTLRGDHGAGVADDGIDPCPGHMTGRRSQALVEFALVLPILLIMLLGMIDLGRSLVFGVSIQQG